MKNFRFNVLFILFPAAVLACLWIGRDFQGQQGNSFFGIAETEPHILNFDHDLAVRKLFIKPGDQVSAGDTLAIFFRADLEENEYIRKREMIATETERQAEKAILKMEKELVQAKLDADLQELMTEWRMVQAEDSILRIYKANLYGQNKSVENKVTKEKIEGLKNQIAERKQEAEEELSILEARIKATEAVADVQTNKLQGQITIMEAERDRLVLLSPINGYVENVYFSLNALIPAHKDYSRAC